MVHISSPLTGSDCSLPAAFSQIDWKTCRMSVPVVVERTNRSSCGKIKRPDQLQPERLIFCKGRRRTSLSTTLCHLTSAEKDWPIDSNRTRSSTLPRLMKNSESSIPNWLNWLGFTRYLFFQCEGCMFMGCQVFGPREVTYNRVSWRRANMVADSIAVHP